MAATKRTRAEKPSEESAHKTKMNQLIRDIQNKYGDLAVIGYADKRPPSTVLWTKVPSFDLITGGFPISRIVEFLGPGSSTKSFMTYCITARFQSPEFRLLQEQLWASSGIDPEDVPETSVALVDVEGTYTKEWGRKVFGIDNEKLIYVQPESMEQAADITQVLLQDPAISLVVFDSMSYAGAKGEVEESSEKDQMAINARFWNKTIRKFGSAMNKNRNLVRSLIVINSEYSKIGIFGGSETKNGGQLKLSKSLSVSFQGLND